MENVRMVRHFLQNKSFQVKQDQIQELQFMSDHSSRKFGHMKRIRLCICPQVIIIHPLAFAEALTLLGHSFGLLIQS